MPCTAANARLCTYRVSPLRAFVHRSKCMAPQSALLLKPNCAKFAVERGWSWSMKCHKSQVALVQGRESKAHKVIYEHALVKGSARQPFLQQAPVGSHR